MSIVQVNFNIFNQISLKILSEGPVDNKSSLVPAMARYWTQTGDKHFLEPMIPLIIDMCVSSGRMS